MTDDALAKALERQDVALTAPMLIRRIPGPTIDSWADSDDVHPLRRVGTHRERGTNP